MDFSKLTQNNWIAAGGGLVAFISGFFPWFSWGDASIGAGLGIDTSFNQSGFDAGIFAILGVLLALAAGVIIVLKAMDIQDVNVNNLSAEQIAMVLAAVGALFILLRILFAPGGFGVDASRAWGGFLAFLAAGATAAGAFLSAKDLGIGIPTADDFTGGTGGDSTGGGTSTF